MYKIRHSKPWPPEIGVAFTLITPFEAIELLENGNFSHFREKVIQPVGMEVYLLQV